MNEFDTPAMRELRPRGSERDTITITETMMDAEGLFDGKPWPETVFVRYTGPDGMGAGIEITGEREHVLQFIRDGWGDDEADNLADWLDEQEEA